ncbi:MAG: DNA internalization-related competence protein ComEC/Rec2 [Gemmatimonadota bacterium]|nr:DNA internalization-related competence protein ComEC/Rec2 [Gemmatimonadota bacterium]
MPLVAWSVLVYSAGLLSALSVDATARVALLAMTLAASVVLTTMRRGLPAGVSAVAAGAVIVAMVITRVDAACDAVLVASHVWRAEFESDAGTGSLARAVVTNGSCSSHAALLVVKGSAAAGQGATVVGRATVGERGVFIENASIDAVASGALFPRARALAGRRIDRIFGGDAPMVRALVIADRSAIPADERDRYARAGVAHMLSVSGLHVGIVALALNLLASILRLPLKPARLVTVALLTAYVAAIGAPPSAVRATVMLGAILVTRLMQRPTSPWAILALGAAAPLWDAHAVLDLGWQLSVAGTAALIAGSALSRRIVSPKWTGWRRSLASAGTISIVATAVTAPLVAWAFGRISLLGPITNLVADPIMGLLQPLLFIAMAVPIHGVEQFTADAAHVLLFAFAKVCAIAASVPGAAPAALPSALGALAAGVASVALVWACQARHPARASFVCLSALALLIIEPILPSARRPVELHMIDVGQGDAFALRTGRGRWIAVDAGRSWIGGDAGKNTVAPYLAHRGGSLALFILSHPHSDHVGGAASLFAMMPPSRFLDPGYVGTSPPYLAALREAQAEHVPWQRVRPGDSLVVDDVVVTALAPDSAWASTLADANLASSVLSVRIGSTRVLFTGDAEGPEEEWLLEHGPDALRADVLKVGHHGSSTSTSAAFLEAVHPRVALVSVGAHNTYGHPSASVMNALRTEGITTLRTDQLGTVVLRFLPGSIEAEAHGQRWKIALHSNRGPAYEPR